jgi:hypothetical protein
MNNEEKLRAKITKYQGELREQEATLMKATVNCDRIRGAIAVCKELIKEELDSTNDERIPETVENLTDLSDEDDGKVPL